jgi:hypothetical protein
MSFINKMVPVLLLVCSLGAMDHPELSAEQALYAAVRARDVERTRLAIVDVRLGDDAQSLAALVRAFELALEVRSAVIARMLNKNFNDIEFNGFTANVGDGVFGRHGFVRTPSPVSIFGILLAGNRMDIMLSNYAMAADLAHDLDAADFFIDVLGMTYFSQWQLRTVLNATLINSRHFSIARRLVERGLVGSELLERMQERPITKDLKNIIRPFVSEKERYLDSLIELAKEVEAGGAVRSSAASSSSSSGASLSGGPADGDDSDSDTTE